MVTESLGVRVASGVRLVRSKCDLSVNEKPIYQSFRLAKCSQHADECQAYSIPVLHVSPIKELIA